MEAFLEKFEHLKHFNLEEIKSITGDFDSSRVIGEGGFGKVYQGVLSDSKGEYTVAFKRLSRDCGQGNPEFLKEIFMLSRYKHENLISLLGFCDEVGEKILAYEHASNGSLDRHLSSPTLTWTQRLKICLGAAKALCYLHDPKETHQRVIHRDIKSSNILLDGNWNAKVSDMGLSKIGPAANQEYSFIATNVVGTYFYIDPRYMETSILTKESDVYSFGVVLFEVMCGSLCFAKKDGRFQSLLPWWKKSYKENKVDEIIFHDLKQDMNMASLETFSEIAYQCLKKSREDRPKMSLVVEKLEIALRLQPEIPDITIEKFKEKVKTAVSKEEVDMLLFNGIIINKGNTWFSLNKNGEHCEMLSAECFECDSYYRDRISYPKEDYVPFDGETKSRFELGRYQRCLYSEFKAHVRTQFLSPHITYKVNLVLKYINIDARLARIKGSDINYKLAGEEDYLHSYVSHTRGDGWLGAELYHFINDTTSFVDLEIEFRCEHALEVEGIEFVPLEKVQHELLLEDEEVDLQTDSYWEQKLPTDYEDIIKWSKDSLQWTTKKELYSIFCKGFLINDGDEWFSLAKIGKKCHMLSAEQALDIYHDAWELQSLPESRFGKVAFDPNDEVSFYIYCKSKILSPQTAYGTYLVYKLQENHSWFEAPVKCAYKFSRYWHIYLLSPKAPDITGKIYPKTALPQQRNDGWMEVLLYEFQTDAKSTQIKFDLCLSHFKSLKGLIMEGIEFKPI